MASPPGAIHPGFPVPRRLRPVLYWGPGIGERPYDFVDPTISAWRREALAFVLRNGVDAHPGIQAKGWASCRICGAPLGSMDLSRFGFVWPEKAEHYVLSHDVWTSECSALLDEVLSRVGSRADESSFAAAELSQAPKRPAAKLFEFSARAGKRWWFESTGPAFFNEWSIAHLGWGIIWQLLFPGHRFAGLVVHTIYESIERHIFPAVDRDVSMENHIGDTAAFAAGMLVGPSTGLCKQPTTTAGVHRTTNAPRRQR